MSENREYLRSSGTVDAGLIHTRESCSMTYIRHIVSMNKNYRDRWWVSDCEQPDNRQ